VEKAIKCSCAVWVEGEKGNFDSVLNFKYFIQAVKFP
jgi:hypothetical protein